MATPAKPIVMTFGPYEFNPRLGELRKDAMRVRLEGQPLAILESLLDRPGELVTREALRKKLWPEDTFVDFEHSLNAAVKRLRAALNDSPDQPHYIETLARRGYRFIAPVNTAGSEIGAVGSSVTPKLPVAEPKYIETIPGRGYRFIGQINSGEATPLPIEPEISTPWWNRKATVTGAAAVIVLGTAVLAYYWTRPPATPKVSNYVQLTHDGLPKALVGTDGSRLYLSLGSDVSLGIGEIALTGGEPTRIPAPFPGAYPLNLSPDGSQLLVIKSKIGPGNRSLYSLALSGGSARRLGDALGWDGAWSPDGKLLAYSNDSNLFMAKADGTESRKLIRMKAHIYSPVWSPDGTHLRFEAEENWEGSLWEIATDGTGVHRLLPPGWHNPSDECCGRWTADGSYFVFQSSGQIWALPKNGGFLHRNPSPIQLTSSPLALSSPLPSKDGKKLFVVGETDRGELVRYDPKSGQFVPFLGGISADFLDFSRDGQWVAYISYPEGTLWCSKADGSERLQLTFGPDHAIMPRWSPDGKKIIFEEQRNAGKGYRIYEVSAGGGTPRELLASDQSSQLHADWSPDGAKIVFGGGWDDPQSVIRILDFTGGQISTVPGSHGFFFPRWSPNGRYIVARAFGPHRLVLFDFQTQLWTELVQGSQGTESWSKDGLYVYDLLASPISAVVRIRISDHKSQQVVDLKNFKITGVDWLALAPDDSPVLLRDTGIQDVYALDWEEP